MHLPFSNGGPEKFDPSRSLEVSVTDMDRSSTHHLVLVIPIVRTTRTVFDFPSPGKTLTIRAFDYIKYHNVAGGRTDGGIAKSRSAC